MIPFPRSAIGPVAAAPLLLLALVGGLALTAPEARAGRALPVSDEVEALYRRVLTRPGAELVASRGGDTGQALAPFQVFYVYAQDDEWTEVGQLVEGDAAGFIRTEKTLDWNSSIVATFNNRIANDRDRMLIFETREKLVDLIRAENVTGAAAAYRAAAIDGAPWRNRGSSRSSPRSTSTFANGSTSCRSSPPKT